MINIDTVSVELNLEAVVYKTTEEFESLGVGTNNEDTNSDDDKES